MNDNKIKNIIIDTDLGADSDDVGAIVLASAFEDLSLCKILAVIHSTRNPYGVAVIDILKRFYKRNYLLGGYLKEEFYTNEKVHVFDKDICDIYGSKYVNNITQDLDSIRLYRKILSEAEDNSIIIASIGQFSNLNNLLLSKGDDISPLDGFTLIKNKVHHIVSMATLINDNHEVTSFNNNERFPEYNIACDILDAKEFISSCPKEIIFIDFYLGVDVWTGKPLMNKPSPFKEAYIRYNKDFLNHEGRSWDLIAIYYAIKEDLYQKIGPGNMVIDDKGYSSFIYNKNGKHYYLRPTTKKEIIEETINNYLKVMDKYE